MQSTITISGRTTKLSAPTPRTASARNAPLLRHGRFTADHVRAVIDDEMAELGNGGRLREARALFEQVALADDFPDFLTLPAYELLD